MLTKWDEYLIHQTQKPIREMAGEEEEWHDHFCFIVQPPDAREGPFFLTTLWSYPNANVMYGATVVTLNNAQYNLHASRTLHNDRADTAVGPFSYAVVEPLKRWHISLSENPHLPISWELDFEGKAEPYVMKRVQMAALGGSNQSTDYTFVIQMGRVSGGTIKVDGRSYDPKGYVVFRDRGWGIAPMNRPMDMWNIVGAHFQGRSLSFFYDEGPGDAVVYLDGALMPDNGKAVLIAAVKHEHVFEQGTRVVKRAEWDLEYENGKRARLAGERVLTSAFLRGAWTGNSFWENKGELFVDGDKWDLTDKGLELSLSAGLREIPMRFTLDGEVGYGFLEARVSRRNRKYGGLL